jgi:hypothetical protein
MAKKSKHSKEVRAGASRLRVNSEGESTRGWRAEWDWQRPAQVQVELEVESQALVEPEFVDTAVSDLPAEVDLAALPRWMRAVPEQGPPEELEFGNRPTLGAWRS